MNKVNILGSIVLLLLVSLSVYGQDRVEFTFESDKLQKINFSSWFSDVHPVILETNQLSLFSEIRKVSVNKRVILILAAKNVLIFSSDGKFINRLQTGRGPSEIIFPRDICITDNLIFVADINSSIKVYNLKGEFIKSLQVGIVCNNIEALNDDLLFLYTFRDPTSEFSLYKYRVSTNTLQDEYFKVPKFRDKGIANTNPFSKSNRGISYLNLFSDTIYTFNEQGIFTTHLDFGSYSLPKSYYTKFSEEDSPIFSTPSKKVTSLVMFHSIGSTIMFNAHVGPSKPARFIYDRSSGKIEVGFPAVFYINDIISLRVLGRICGSTNNELIFGIQSTHYIGFLNDIKDELSKEEYDGLLRNYPFIDKVLSKISIDSNPVLFFVEPN